MALVGARLIAPTLIAAVFGSATLLAGCSASSQSSPTTTPPSTTATASSPAAETSTQSPSGPAPSTSQPSSTNPAGTAQGSVQVDRTIAGGLNVPWGLALLPGGDILVTARDDHQVSRIDLRSGDRTVLGTIGQAVSNVDSGGEAGLLGIAISPSYDSDHHLFVYYSTAKDNRIARLTYDPQADRGKQLTQQRVILSGIPQGLHHNGGRIAFGPDKMLYVTTGEAGDPDLSQDKSSLGGKILRMTATGKPASGNPDKDSVVWTSGHRNVQGLAWDPAGRLWASEFGDKSADELNLIKAGHNYGWPETQGRTDDPRFTGPVAQWGTDEDSPSGIAFAAGSIWMAALQGERLWRIPLDGTEPVADPQDRLTDHYGRLRSVLTIGPDTILVTTSNTDGRADPGKGDDRILQLTVS